MFAQLKEDIRSVFERDPAARNMFEVLTTYPGLHALLMHRFCHALWRRKMKWLARWLSTVSRFLTGIEIHPGAVIGRRFFIDHGMGVVIGETAEVGDDVTLYHGVTLGGTSLAGGKRHPTLADGVVVGAGAKILGPFTVGAGARVGSNAVVVKEVPEGATVVGVPGRIVRRGPKKGLRDEVSQTLGFDAYGMRGDMPDPTAEVMSKMLDHIEQTDRRLEQMCTAMRALGKNVEGVSSLRADLSAEQLAICCPDAEKKAH